MTRRQLTDEQRRLIAPFPPIRKYSPYPERLRNQFEGAMWRFRTDAQWREISRRVRNRPTAYGCFRPGGTQVSSPRCREVIAEVTRQGMTDLAGGQRGLHDRPCPPRRAGMIGDKDVMKPLEETAAEQEQARALQHPVVHGRARSMARTEPWPRLRPGRCGSDQGRRPGRPRTYTRTDSAHSATGDGGATSAPCGQFAVSAISQVWHTTLRAGIRPDAAPMPTWRVTCT